MFTKEAQTGIEVLKEIVEAERILRLRSPQPMRDRFAYFLEVNAFNKEWKFTLSGEVLSDLPNMPEYKKSAQLFAHELAKRMQNPIQNSFYCRSERPVSIEIEWPLQAMPLRAASALSIYVRDTRHGTVAHCYVVVTHQQSIFDLKSNPFLIQSGAVNSVRSAIDDGSIIFYPVNAHPVEMQQVRFSLDYPKFQSRRDLDSFLRGKVYWLGFRVSNSSARMWVPDTWDAAYLGCETKDILQRAEILAASEELVFDETREFASVGRDLLKKADELEDPKTLRKNSDQPASAAGWDVFISHASEDKPYVEPLVAALENAGIRVWFDKNKLEWGDDLRASIDRGLIACRYGIVVFSKAFLRKKKWTEYELNSLFAREKSGEKLILPIWHGITRDDLLQYGPSFADRIAKISSTDSYEIIVESLRQMLGHTGATHSEPTVSSSPEIEPAEPKPIAVAFARYETTGENAQRAAAYVRRSDKNDGWFSFENSFGEVEHGTMEKIALRFVAFDRSLTMKGYVRTHYGNSGDPPFTL